MAEQNYIARMRAKVGHDGMIFNTVFGVLWSADRRAILLEKRSDIQKGLGLSGWLRGVRRNPTTGHCA